MTATHPAADRSRSGTTRNLRRRAPTHVAEANHQVGTSWSSRHPAPASTLPRVPPNPLKNHPLPCVTATPAAGSPTVLPVLLLLFLSLLLLRLFTHSLSLS